MVYPVILLAREKGACPGHPANSSPNTTRPRRFHKAYSVDMVGVLIADCCRAGRGEALQDFLSTNQARYPETGDGGGEDEMQPRETTASRLAAFDPMGARADESRGMSRQDAAMPQGRLHLHWRLGGNGASGVTQNPRICKATVALALLKVLLASECGG